jgi:uncharacterized protein
MCACIRLFHRYSAVVGIILTVAASGCALPRRTQQPSSRPEARTNRLARESSPYLLQHAHNPVDWYPWGEEAFAKAKREDKPVFLSVGYAACHWCHVMERESFEDEGVAKLLNADFISIKVDREERPDVDDLYMNAVQLVSGRGGWPMTIFLTPEGKPFYGATYFPREDFKSLLGQVKEAWKGKRKEIDSSADQITAALQRQARLAAANPTVPTRALQTETLDALRDEYDSQYGGFGRAPKFPPHNSFPLLFHIYQQAKDKEALGLALGTLDAMARGGIRDHLGGGFHRYSTDEKWLVPHFEKMLYDNALLARAYTEAYRITGKPLYKEVARETLDWALREMRGPEGGFYSSRDADSAGEEGKYYLWSRKEIMDLLGPADGALFCTAYNVQEAGNYLEQTTRKPNGTNILHLKQPLAELARKRGAAGPSFLASLARVRARLTNIRIERLPPALDDKRLTSWNALMIGSLAHCGQVLKEPRYTQAAQKAAGFVLTQLQRDGKLLRRWRPVEGGGEGATKRVGDIPGFLDDYAYMIDALLDLHAADKNRQWVHEAAKLADTMITLFADKAGGFFDTPAGHETLIVRGKNGYDQAIPSANAVAARALLRLFKLTGKSAYRQQAEVSIRSLGGLTTRQPRAAQTMVLSSLLYLDEKRGTAVHRTPYSGSARPRVDTPVRLEVVTMGGRGSWLSVQILIREGWHINSTRPRQPDLIPTKLEIVCPPGIVAGSPKWPDPKDVRVGFSSEILSVYTGTARVIVRLNTSKAKTGTHVLKVRLRYQACDDKACLAPATAEVKIPFVWVR